MRYVDSALILLVAFVLYLNVMLRNKTCTEPVIPPDVNTLFYAIHYTKTELGYTMQIYLSPSTVSQAGERGLALSQNIFIPGEQWK